MKHADELDEKDDFGYDNPNYNNASLTSSYDLQAIDNLLKSMSTSINSSSSTNNWTKCYDDEGVYYWHKPTGTVTRTQPTVNDISQEKLSSASHLSESLTSSHTSSSLEINFNNNHLDMINSNDTFTASYPNEQSSSITTTKRFYVSTLGWTKIDEELTQESSSRVINKCISELTRGRNDAIARWGNGKDLYMDIDETNMCLVNPFDDKILLTQPIIAIKVWGVSRENSRDFAYVSRDHTSKEYQCHVYRSEGLPAKEIANTLKESLNKNMSQNEHKSSTRVEEARKTIRCLYIGSTQVTRPSGMSVLNEAVSKIYRESVYKAYEDLAPVDEDSIDLDDIDEFVMEKWCLASLTISPSNIIACKLDENEEIFDCRIRYLTFLGISLNVKICGLIVYSFDGTFNCHAFYNEPSAGPLCKLVEAACKLRYQKCLDAHPQAAAIAAASAQIKQPSLLNVSKIGSTLNTIVNFIKNKSLKR